MLPTTPKYTVWPCVIPADTPVEMTITPAARAFLPVEGETYDISVIDVDADNDYYENSQPQHKLTAKAHNGVLQFRFAFSGEMEHVILLSYQGKQLEQCKVYSLLPDLYRLRPCKGDLHMHTYRSDGSNDPGELLASCREMGYDFAAITDHNRYFPGTEAEEAYAGLRMGFCRVPGEEIHTPGSAIHIVHVGGHTSVAEEYLRDHRKYEGEVDAYEAKLTGQIPEKYRRRYAMAQWATDHIREAGGVAVFAHPFWKPASQKYNICEEFSRLLLTSGMFDAFEVMGVYTYSALASLTAALWQELRAEGLQISPIGSSDVHNTVNASSFPQHFTVCFAEENTSESLTDAIRQGLTVAVRGTPLSVHDRYEYHCHGSFRLVAYTHFLLDHYFPRRQRICQCEGIAMRQYLMGEAEGALVEAQARQSEDFWKRYFGRKAPVLPTREILEYEERWREVQRNGPVTAGGKAFGEKISRQI